MALRFTRRISILPGIRLNVSKSGISLTLGPRGASITLGPRGTYANVGLPGTGISYRKRLDGKAAPSSTTSAKIPPPEPGEGAEYVERLFGLLASREREPVDWKTLAAGRRGSGLARRLLAGDREVWGDILQAELADEDLPFPFNFDFSVDSRTGRIWIATELPGEEIIPNQASRPLRVGGNAYRKLPQKIIDALYEDACCALLLRIAHETYRVLPDADVLELQGYRPDHGSGNGAWRRAVLLELVTGRWSFSRLDLDQVDPSAAFEHLGGESRKEQGRLLTLRFEAAEFTRNETDISAHEPVSHAAEAPSPQATAGVTSGAALIVAGAAEERELSRLRAELAEREGILLQREVDLATLRAELHAFEQRYLQRVGSLYAELDELQARIAELIAQRQPADAGAQERAEQARAQARESAHAAEEAAEAPHAERFSPTEALKKLFRNVARRIHPDLVTDPVEREERTRMMAEVNRAYEQGDEERLRRILEDWQSRPEAVRGDGPAAERERLLRRIAQVNERIQAVEAEIAALRQSDLYRFKVQVEEEEAMGADPLGDLARDLEHLIWGAEVQLETLEQEAAAT